MGAESRGTSIAVVAFRLLTALVLLSGGQAMAASGNDVMRLLTNQLNGTTSECQRLKNWAQGVLESSPYGNGRQPSQATLALAVQDAVFVRFFGKPYDELPPQSFQLFQGLWRECERAVQYTPFERSLILHVWASGQQGRLAAGVSKSRNDQIEFDGILTTLPQLTPTEEDFSRLQTMRARGESLTANATDEAKQVFKTRLLEAWQRVGVPVERQRIMTQVEGAHDAAGLNQLTSIRDGLAGKDLPESVRADLTHRVDTRIANLLPVVVSEERRNGLAFAPSYDGLLSSAEWVRDFDRRFRQLLAQQTPLNALRQEVMQRRLRQLDALTPQLERKLSTSLNLQELNSLSNALLLPEERTLTTAARLIEVSNRRREVLERISKDQAMFGRQPEHDALLAGAPSSKRESPAAARKATPTYRCDELAAHPSDPDRRADGVEDEALNGKAVLVACDEALQKEKDSGRLHMQRARGLLALQRVNEAIHALQQGVKHNNAVAHQYLAFAYEEGAGGLPKDTAKAARLKGQAEKLGIGNEAKHITAAANQSDGSGVLTDPRQLDTSFEFGTIMRAVYWGDSSSLTESTLFRYAYLYGQAHSLGELCKTFKLTELDAYQDNLARMRLPSDMGSVFSAANLSKAFTDGMRVLSNPKAAVDIGRAERRVSDAPTYGAKDLVTFVRTYAKNCEDPHLRRYTANLKSYLRNAGS